MEKIVFWKDKSERLINPALFSTIAESFAVEIARDNNNRGNPNKPTQLRKFFDEIVRLNMEAKSNPEAWNHVLPLVHMVTAKAAYAMGRNLISDTFLSFIRNSVEQTETPEDLNLFVSFFESFIGFYKLHGPSK